MKETPELVEIPLDKCNSIYNYLLLVINEENVEVNYILISIGYFLPSFNHSFSLELGNKQFPTFFCIFSQSTSPRDSNDVSKSIWYTLTFNFISILMLTL